MKSILVVATDMRTATRIKYRMLDILGELFDITACSVDDTQGMLTRVDAVVISELFLNERLAEMGINTTETICFFYSLQRKSLPLLENLSSERNYYVANINLYEEERTIELFSWLGYGHLTFIPYHNCLDMDLSQETIITPNEKSSITTPYGELIDIGDRQVDPLALLGLVSKLNLLSANVSEKLSLHLQNTVPRFLGLKNYFNLLSGTGISHNQITEANPFGVLYVKKGIIDFANHNAATILKRKISEIVGASEVQLFPEFADGCSEIIHKNVDNTQIYVQKVVLNSSTDESYIQIISEYKYRNIGEQFNRCRKESHLFAKYHFEDIIGKSPALLKSITLAKIFATSDVPIMILGDSGTGKEVFAQSIHNASLRKDAPFVAFNCAALTDSLVQSELFGYEKSSFTGASKTGKVGLIERANSGTLFMDEIAELSLTTQAMLLRTLQEGEVLRVGGAAPIPVNIRIIAATNKDLRTMIREGKFREDLYFRLNTLCLNIPPLTQRKEDIRPIIMHYLNKMETSLTISADVMDLIECYNWPGNIRELINFIYYYSQISKSDLSAGEKFSIVLEYFERNGQLCEERSVAPTQDTVTYSGIKAKILELFVNADANTGYGRGYIVKCLQRQNIQVKESTVRKALVSLRDHGYITTNSGRAGSKITIEGREVYSNMISHRNNNTAGN